MKPFLTVFIEEPKNAIKLPSGSHFIVSAKALGTHPIASLELWLDGNLIEQQTSAQHKKNTILIGQFDVLVPSVGEHNLLVRARDVKGNVSQSASLPLLSEENNIDYTLAVLPQHGETIEDIATNFQVQKEDIKTSNPLINIQDNVPLSSQETLYIPAPYKEEPPPTSTPEVLANTLPNLQNVVSPMQVFNEKSIGIISQGLFIPQLISENKNPPTAPTNLQAEVKGCKIRLTWQDNATNEEVYNIYMQSVNKYGFSEPYLKLNPAEGSGLQWYEFDAPLGGGFSLWLEAENIYGSNPSSIAFIYVMPGCPIAAVDQLMIKIKEITLNSLVEKAYCYVSLQGSLKTRIPFSESNFFSVQKGIIQSNAVNNTAWAAEPSLYQATIDYPKEHIVQLNGECWGLFNDYPSKISDFSIDVLPEFWHGQDIIVKGNSTGFQGVISITTISDNKGLSDFSSSNPTLSIPYDLKDEEEPINQAHLQTPSHILSWKWDGDIKKLKSFEIFLNGKPYSSVINHVSEMTERVYYPGRCGITLTWQVAANENGKLSNLSTPLKIQLPPCKRFLRVSFDKIELRKTDDGWTTPGSPCETLDVYYHLSVKDINRSFYNSNLVLPLKCGDYYFSQIGGKLHKDIYGNYPHVFTIPLDANEDASALWIRAIFWDRDPWPSADDKFASMAEHPLAAYLIPGEEIWTHCSQKTSTVFKHDTANTTIYFSYAIYPNVCWDVPPPEDVL